METVADSLRILYVVPNVPSPIRVRPFNLIKGLSARHRIHLVTLVAQAGEERHLEAMSTYCESVRVFRLGREEGALNTLRGLTTGLPLRLAYFASSALRAYLAREMELDAYDVYHLEHAKVIPLVNARRQSRPPVVLDAVDSLSLLLERHLDSNSMGAHRVFTKWELGRTRRFEATALEDVDGVTVTSDVDADRFRQLSSGRVDPVVLPNGVDSEFFSYHEGCRDLATLVFAAKLDYFPNAQAAQHLVTAILPLVARRRPGVRLLIVGSNPPRGVRKLAVPGRIEVTGYVDDIRPYLHRATVAVAPLLTKAGIQNKLLEALASGTPTVATPLAWQGLQATPGQHLLTAHNTADFADQVLRLLDDHPLRRQLAVEGRKLVVGRYSWAEVTSRLETVYGEAIRRSRAALVRSTAALE